MRRHNDVAGVSIDDRRAVAGERVDSTVHAVPNPQELASADEVAVLTFFHRAADSSGCYKNSAVDAVQEIDVFDIGIDVDIGVFTADNFDIFVFYGRAFSYCDAFVKIVHKELIFLFFDLVAQDVRNDPLGDDVDVYLYRVGAYIVVLEKWRLARQGALIL